LTASVLDLKLNQINAITSTELNGESHKFLVSSMESNGIKFSDSFGIFEIRLLVFANMFPSPILSYGIILVQTVVMYRLNGFPKYCRSIWMHSAFFVHIFWPCFFGLLCMKCLKI